jgi:hypothetical protein
MKKQYEYRLIEGNEKTGRVIWVSDFMPFYHVARKRRLANTISFEGQILLIERREKNV